MASVNHTLHQQRSQLERDYSPVHWVTASVLYVHTSTYRDDTAVNQIKKKKTDLILSSVRVVSSLVFTDMCVQMLGCICVCDVQTQPAHTNVAQAMNL